MQTISLIDRRTKKGSKYKGPGSWAELTKAQFMLVINAKAQISDVFKQAVLLTQLLLGKYQKSMVPQAQRMLMGLMVIPLHLLLADVQLANMNIQHPTL